MAVNLERARIREQGGSLTDYSTPDELIAQINELRNFYKEKYNSEVEFEYDCGYSDSRYLYAYYYRDESDKEMAERIENETRWEVIRAEQEAKEFARLKAKFEKKD